jgi:archaellum component FlaC
MLNDQMRKLDGELDNVNKDLCSLQEELDMIGKSVDKLEESFTRLMGMFSR